MKHALALGFLTIIATSAVVVQTSEGQEKGRGAADTALIATFTKLENEWAEADKNLDATALGRLLADDWFFLGPTGTETKAQHLASLKKGDESIESITLLDLKVRVYGDIAVVNGREHEKSTKQNTDTSGDYLYTDVFVRRDGRWQAVNSQDTPLTHK
jgi:ketosteroid isomerase-like protein